jgi:energy-coupling factor transport system ATP-binding protein
MALIEAKEVEFSYPNGVRALKGVSLTITQGEMVAIIGQNGSGKTTLVKHMNGLLKPLAGVMLVDGQPTTKKEPSQLAALVGIVFQNPDDQIFSTNVWNEVTFGPKNLKLAEAEIKERAMSALEMVKLDKEIKTHPYDLTITERKLLCLASIVAMRPKALILDEPTTAQDQVGVLRLGEIIRSLSSQGTTVITITHDMNFVAEFFARTVVMRQGLKILDGPTQDVFIERELLLSTYVVPTPIALLGQEIGADKEVITVSKMVDWVVKKHDNRTN